MKVNLFLCSMLLVSLFASNPAFAKMRIPTLESLINDSSVIAHVEMVSVTTPDATRPGNQVGTGKIQKILKGDYKKDLINISFSTGKPMSVPYQPGEFVVFLRAGTPPPFHLQGRWFGRMKVTDGSFVQGRSINEPERSHKIPLEELFEKIAAIAGKKPENQLPDKEEQIKEQSELPKPQPTVLERKITRIRERLAYLEGKLLECDPNTQPERYDKIKRKIAQLHTLLRKAEQKKKMEKK